MTHNFRGLLEVDPQIAFRESSPSCFHGTLILILRTAGMANLILKFSPYLKCIHCKVIVFRLTDFNEICQIWYVTEFQFLAT